MSKRPQVNKNLDTTSANIEYEAHYKIVIDEKSREVLWQSGHAVGSQGNTERELQMFVLLITLRKESARDHTFSSVTLVTMALNEMEI